MCGCWNTFLMKIKFKRRLTSLVVVSLSIFNLQPALANGSPDNSFSGDGIFLLDNSLPADVTITAIRMQGTKIIFAGKKDNFLVVGRVNSNGTLDTNFSGDGTFELVNSGTQDRATDLYVSSTDGSILVAGERGLGIVLFKLDSEGVLDTTFNPSGMTPGIRPITINDTQYAGTEYLTQPSLSVSPNETEIFLSANRWYRDINNFLRFELFSTKFDSTGSQDTDYRKNVADLYLQGYFSTSEYITGGFLQIGGNYYDGSTTQAQIISLDSAGNLNTNFNSTGILTFSPATSMTSPPAYWDVQLTDISVESSGNLIVTGSVMDGLNTAQEADTYVTRVNNAGQVLQSGSFVEADSLSVFGNSPKVQILPDGKILILTEFWKATADPSVNQQTSRLMRLNNNLSLDSTFGSSGIYDYANLQNLRALTLQEDNKIVVGGIYTDITTVSFLVIRQNWATVPDSPNIGVATATGSTTASVSFTAPVNNGGSTITSYTINAWNDALSTILKTQTYSSSLPALGASATFTVTGLTPSTVYRFSVAATNSEGDSSQSFATSSVTTSAASSGAGGGGTDADELRRQQEAAAAAKQKQDQELKEILSLVPSIAGLAQGVAGLGNSLLLPKKCVKGKLVKNVKAGAKCPKGYKVRR
jgi:uncharacterized delta-60 repeat protein